MAERTVVAGFDGSAASARAARWAARDAVLQRASLHLVLAHDSPKVRAHAQDVVRGIAVTLRNSFPDLHVADEAVLGDPVDELLERSCSASLLVVGSRGHGAVRDVLLGSVSSAVATHARCTAVVVRGEDVPGPVVVGIDLSRASLPALWFAFASAHRRGSELVAVQAVPDAYFLPGILQDPRRQEVQQRAERHVSAQLADCASRYPDVVVRRTTSDQHPVEALCEQADSAQLVVVGRRERSGFAGTRLGSTALGTLHHAPCPVAVVPDADTAW